MCIGMIAIVCIVSAGAESVVDAALDASITAQIESMYLTREQINPLNINTTTVDRIVTLTGGVKNAAQKREVEEIARSVKDVKEVKNLLIVMPVKPDAGDPRTWRQKAEDKATVLAVRARLMGNGRFEGVQIGITCFQGQVTLTGVVNSAEERTEVGTIAAETRGVEKVLNDLTIQSRKPGTSMEKVGRRLDDGWVEKRVETAIILHQYVSIRDLDVEVVDGKCILTGTVDTENEKALAGTIAGGIQGVQKVQNDILVHRRAVELQSIQPNDEPNVPPAEPPRPVLQEKPLTAPK